MLVDYFVLSAPAGQREDYNAHIQRNGVLERCDRSLIDAVAEVALTGRGGAHFPVARKWQPVLEAMPTAARLTVVVNAAEGEPSSRKDAEIMRRNPHLVLDGAVALSQSLVTGTYAAADIVVWLHEGDDISLSSIQRAMTERASLDEPPMRVMLAPARYVSGESTSVIRAVQSERRTGKATAFPRFTPDPARPWIQDDADGNPILVHNCETMARIGQIARVGALSYRATSLVTVTTPGGLRVLEVGPDITFATLLASLGVVTPSAVLLGGYGGQWVEWLRITDLPVDPDALRTHGLSLGAGIIIPLAPDECGLRKTAEIASWMAGQSAKACGPCTFGLPAVAELMEKISHKAKSRDLRELREVCGLIPGRGACRHPDGTVRMVVSALEVFAEDLDQHSHKHCLAHPRKHRR